MSTPFQVYAELDVFEKADDPHPMRIGGIVSTAHLDKQDEQILQRGLDFGPFLSEGWYNDNHGQRTTDVLGYPTMAKYVQKGETLPNGKPAANTGWYTEGYLVNTPEARKVYAIAQTLNKAPNGRKLGFSIEGQVTRRRAGEPNVIERAVVRNVAITHCPVNPHTALEVLTKALTAGSAISAGDLNQGPGDGGALRAESLEGGRRRRRGRNRGLAVQEFELVKAAAPEFDLVKADDGPVVSMAEYLAPFMPIAARHVAEALRDEPMTKSEAEILIRRRFPQATAADIRRILNHAGGQR